ncbi:AAA family ATPase [Halobacillus litoralis]|uniref:ATP-binding protein n=1 Tax=Halobacillus litoralis TaxID=45668 RepID=UPI001CD6A281|nr:AAA family ATPase [Halobacillus litoralis]MCA0969679.1 AAA family ATPase [Halobacillus litoralis]
MKIKEATIYGFGKWKDTSFSFSTEGITTIAGKNEAGKSTLQQFLLFMLFGLPPKQRAFYKPKTGGAVGGRLLIELPSSGTVLLERMDDVNNGSATCTLENGEEYGEAFLQECLKGTDREVFRSIFSFTAEDLLELRRLDGYELGEVLLNIGLTGSNHIYETEKWLERNANERFRPKGRKPSINKQLDQVEQLAKQRSSKEAEVQSYETLKEQKVVLEERIRQSSDQVKKLHREQFQYEKLEKAVPLLTEYHQRKKVVQDKVAFPENGRERYHQVKEAILPLESEGQFLQQSLNDLNVQMADIEAELADERLYEAAQNLINHQSDFQQTSSELTSLEKRMTRLQEQLQEDMRYMDVGLEREELTSHAFPFYLEETWRALKDESRELQAEEEKVTEERKRIYTEQQQLSDEKDALEADMISEEEAETLARNLDQVMTKNGRRSKASDDKSTHKKNFTTAFFALMVVGWVVHSVLNVPLFGWLLIIAGLGIGIYTVLLHLRNRNQPEEVPAVDENWEEWRQDLQRYERQRNEKEHLDEQIRRLNQDELQLDEKRRQVIQKGHRLEARLQEQERIFPFLTHVSIDHWDKLFHLVTQAQQKQLEWEQLTKEHDDKLMFITQKKNKIKEFYEFNNWEVEEEQTSKSFDRVRKWNEHQNELRSLLKRLLKQEEQERLKLKEIRIRLETIAKERQSLFEKAGVSNEEEFYQQLAIYEKQQTEKKALKDVVRQLEGILSEDEQGLFRIWDESIDETKVKVSKEEAQQSREKVEQELLSNQQQLADIHHSLSKLETSDDYSRSLHHLQSKRNELEEEAREWAVYQVALQLLHQTKAEYKESYLPQVMEKASHYFARLTEGHYNQILLSTADDQILVKHKDRNQYRVNELSRGTKDQLYVSLRLALGQTMGASISLPFIIDDAFVHFDEERLEETFSILKEISKDHQIIFFTWRQDLHQMMASTSIQYLS